MKIISKCERQFVSSCIIKKQKRLDGREFSQGRTLEIVFGKESGCCIVIQGNTRVLAQVSSEITEPKKNAPADGIIHVNFEFSPMASPEAKSYSRTSDEFIEIQRSLERCVRDSKCIELETLCIISGSKVWTIRIDIHALNDDGNITECASIAAISALAHFRRPEVTTVGSDVIKSTMDEKPPVALNLRHMPISINLALFGGAGQYILVDPTEMEEKVCDGCYIIGMNAHQEICFLHRRGVLLLKEEAIIRCEDVAIKRAQEVTQIIRSALDDDAYKRTTGASIGFTNLIQTGTIFGAKRQMAEISLDNIPNEVGDTDIIEPMESNGIIDVQDEHEEVILTTSQLKSKAKKRALLLLEESTASVFEGGHSKWGESTDNNESEEEKELDSQTGQHNKWHEDTDDASEEEVAESKPDISGVKSENISSDSEEEVVYIDNEQLDIKAPKSRGWFIKDPFE